MDKVVETDTQANDPLTKAALEYHEYPTPGKIAVTPTKSMSNQRELALAYSPGVAAACMAIHHDQALASRLTSRANLVAVVSNGTAVLGLGNIGPVASKPVMEGKGCLFKKFANIDVFDIEVGETDPDKIVEIVAALEPTFGGINLEDIKAPECFQIEQKLRARMKIPVFHDDQHGTAIVAAAAILNGLKVVGKRIEDVRLVCSGAGAAAIACLDLLIGLGLKPDKILVTDSKGVLHTGRTGLDASKQRYARQTDARTLADSMPGADVFLGVSMAGVLKPEMVEAMADRPLILALANPDPEIRPEDAKRVRPDCIIATGRSDYPNQVNNVLCFPFIFRGALDVGATAINEEMKLAATRALADLAQAEQSDVVAQAYGVQDQFGPEHLIPRPFDPRLITTVAPAVAEAAMRSGVATRPLDDITAYRERLGGFVYRSGTVMQPLFAAAAAEVPKRVVFADGENERVLRAVQAIVDERLAKPILIGRPEVIRERMRQLGLRISEERGDFAVQSFQDDTLGEAAETYYLMRRRDGITRDYAQLEMRRNRTLVGAMLVRGGRADAMLCGIASGRYAENLRHIQDTIGLRPGVNTLAAMNLLLLPQAPVFLCDTHINYDPTTEQLVEISMLAAEEVRRFGLTPRVALLSHSSFGSADTPSARKMRAAAELLAQRAPDLEVEGEVQGDAALSQAVLDRVFPNSRLTGSANLLIMPNLDAANITFSCLRVVAGQGVTVGPILLGAAKPVHILAPTTTVRGMLNMTAVACAEAAVEK
ncbi:MAG TPA: NADP-dependent malic enzyme [Acetobacteraceae bacterium]|nr:NADP-dependent malic enzyme [Acetobacteraceae bacterium]